MAYETIDRFETWSIAPRITQTCPDRLGNLPRKCMASCAMRWRAWAKRGWWC